MCQVHFFGFFLIVCCMGGRCCCCWIAFDCFQGRSGIRRDGGAGPKVDMICRIFEAIQWPFRNVRVALKRCTRKLDKQREREGEDRHGKERQVSRPRGERVSGLVSSPPTMASSRRNEPTSPERESMSTSNIQPPSLSQREGGREGGRDKSMLWHVLPYRRASRSRRVRRLAARRERLWVGCICRSSQ